MSGDFPNGGARRAAVTVALWREGTEIVADAPQLNLHAFGDDIESALANLAARIVDQVRHVDELGDRLAPRMRRERERLRSLLILLRA